MNRPFALEAFLATDPRDVGCEQAMEVLHIYADLTRAGKDPQRRYPGVAAHLRACGPCAEDFDDLLAAVLDPPPGPARYSAGPATRFGAGDR